MKRQKNDSRLEERLTTLEATVKQLVDGVNKQAHLWYATRSAYNFVISNFPKENVEEVKKDEPTNEQ